MTRHLYGEFLTLQSVGVIVGILLIALHAFALVRPQPVQQFLKRFPRQKQIGIAILTIDLLWSLWLVKNIDLGEFHPMRKWLLIGLPVAFILIIAFVDEFLAVRALGVFLLLFACPILEAAFLKPYTSRLLLSTLSYVWIVAALFWVGMPYILRDQIDWASNSQGRWKILSSAGIGYGVVILVCAVAYWGG